MPLSSRCCDCDCNITATAHRLGVGSRAPARNDEAVLEGLAVAGLVAILRQLGDLAELSEEVFQDLHDQVMAASARGRRLAARAKQLEADLPPPLPLHRDLFFLGQTERCSMYDDAADASNRKWRADLKVTTLGVVAGADMPRSIVDYIKRCRGPPRLSLLDKYADDGEGACLKRYTNPSFFRTHSAKLQEAGTLGANGHLKTMETRPKFQSTENPKPPESAHTDCTSEIDASEKPSLGFLSVLRQLKHRQTNESVFPSLKPQTHQNIQKDESSAEGRASSADQSEIDISFTGTPDFNLEMEKAKKNHQDTGQSKGSPTPNYCSDAGSDYGGNRGELERTSSFEAWLSHDARFTPENEIIEESAHGSVNHVVTSNGALGKQNSVAAEISCKKGVSKRSKYKGSVEMIASRVSSLPRKLFMKQQHDPVTDSFRNTDTRARAWRSDHAGGHRSSRDSCSLELFRRASDVPSSCEACPPDSIEAGFGDSITDCNPEAIPREAFLPILVADPVFSIYDSVPENEQCYLHHDGSTRLQGTGGPSHDASVDTQIHHQKNSPSISNRCSSSSSPENCGDPTSTPDSKNLLFPRMQSTGRMIKGSLHRPTGVLPANSSYEGIKVDTPPLPPIPPMQWLSVKVHTGSPAHRKPFIKDHGQRSEAKLLKTTELHPYEAWPEPAGTNQHLGAETHLQQEVRQQFASGDFDNDMQFPDRPTEKPIEDNEFLYRKVTEISAAHGNTLSISDANKNSNAVAIHVDVQNSPARQSNEECSSNLHKENVFFSAVEQLAKMSPPSAPRLKHSLLEAASHDRITLRNGLSLIHPSRNILDSGSVLLEQIKDKSFSLKPVSGMSSTVTGSPTNSRVATILQRADDIRQVHADKDDVDSEDSWSDDSD